MKGKKQRRAVNHMLVKIMQTFKFGMRPFFTARKSLGTKRFRLIKKDIREFIVYASKQDIGSSFAFRA